MLTVNRKSRSQRSARWTPRQEPNRLGVAAGGTRPRKVCATDSNQRTRIAAAAAAHRPLHGKTNDKESRLLDMDAASHLQGKLCKVECLQQNNNFADRRRGNRKEGTRDEGGKAARLFNPQDDRLREVFSITNSRVNPMFLTSLPGSYMCFWLKHTCISWRTQPMRVGIGL